MYYYVTVRVATSGTGKVTLPTIIYSDSFINSIQSLHLIVRMATPEEKYELITRGLQEVLGGDSIKAILAEGRDPKGYWGAYSYYFQSRDN